MKRYLITAIAALSLTACGTSPESVVRDFYTKVADGDTKEAVELISPQARAAWGEKIDVAVMSFFEKTKKCEGIKDLEIEQDKTLGSDDLHVYEVKVTFKKSDAKGCGVDRDTIETINSDGKWYIHFG